MKTRRCQGRVDAAYGSYPCDNEAECFIKRFGAWFSRECARRITSLEAT